LSVISEECPVPKSSIASFTPSDFEAGGAERRGDLVDEVALPELHRRQVDGDGQRREALVLPGAILPAGFEQHPRADRANQAALLGEGNEFVGLDPAAVGLRPADQRLDARDRAVVDAHLRLVVQAERLRAKRLA